MFQRLWEKFKGWTSNSSKIERTRESRSGSRKRTWTFLRGVIIALVSNVHEDDNYFSLSLCLQGISQPTPSAVSPAKPKSKAGPAGGQKVQDALAAPLVDASAPADFKGKGGGKGGKGKGKGKGEGKGKGFMR